MLRQICLTAGLIETAKWGHPCYVDRGRNIAIIGAFRDDFRLTFFNAGLLDDTVGILSRQGANTRHPDMLRLTDAAQIDALRPAITDLLAQAMAHADAGTKAPKETAPLVLPDELVEVLAVDPVLATAFNALTPGRQKSHVLAIGSAKASATRQGRVQMLTPRILSGKGAQER